MTTTIRRSLRCLWTSSSFFYLPFYRNSRFRPLARASYASLALATTNLPPVRAPLTAREEAKSCETGLSECGFLACRNHVILGNQNYEFGGHYISYLQTRLRLGFWASCGARFKAETFLCLSIETCKMCRRSTTANRVPKVA